VDSLQELRIRTSTFAPEFGCTPGEQIFIVTHSGSNQWHGGAIDYLRNDVCNTNDWFAKKLGLPKPEERQNDFGGALGGPVGIDLFFFCDGLRFGRATISYVEIELFDSEVRNWLSRFGQWRPTLLTISNVATAVC